MSALQVFETRFLRFEPELTKKSRKTEVWGVYSIPDDEDPERKDGEPYKTWREDLLGFIQWRTGWRRYVFATEEGTEYDARCLRDIADFCAARMDARKPDASEGRA